MKKILQKSPVLIIAVCLSLIVSSANAQSFGGINIGNLGGFNLDSLNKLKNDFTDFQSLTDSLTKVVDQFQCGKEGNLEFIFINFLLIF